MIVDHTYKLYFNEYIPVIFEIGRLSFPLFAILIVNNYYWYSKDKEKLILRLFIFGLISQIPFSLVFETSMLNIFFTLGAGLLAIYGYENKRYWLFSLPVLLNFIADYKPFGVLLVIVGYIAMIKNTISYWILFSFTILLTNYYTVFNKERIIGNFIVAAILPLIIKLFSNDQRLIKSRMNKYFFYSIYPIHLIILYIFFKI